MQVIDDLALELGNLEDMNIDALRAYWRASFGEPPALRSSDVMRRLLAEKLQMKGLPRDHALERELDRLARAHARGAKVAEPQAQFKAGTVLVREHAGQRHRVEVIDGGFLWNGARWKTLSQIAREITGVRWNGPRFFGLREEGGRR